MTNVVYLQNWKDKKSNDYLIMIDKASRYNFEIPLTPIDYTITSTAFITDPYETLRKNILTEMKMIVKDYMDKQEKE